MSHFGDSLEYIESSKRQHVARWRCDPSLKFSFSEDRGEMVMRNKCSPAHERRTLFFNSGMPNGLKMSFDFSVASPHTHTDVSAIAECYYLRWRKDSWSKL